MTSPIRLAVMSDLHMEGGGWSPPPVEADLIILAGDVGHGTDGVAWASRAFAGRPVVYVAGNHEHWSDDVGRARRHLSIAAAATPNVCLLDHDAVAYTLRGRRLRVLGCTLWTDFALLGADRVAAVMAEMRGKAPDFRHVGLGDGGMLQPEIAAGWHARARRWLDEELARAEDVTTVVVTHHAPSPRSLKPALAGRPSTAGAASDLEPLILRHRPTLWAHGHTHHDADYWIGETRVVARQRGSAANAEFVPLVVEV